MSVFSQEERTRDPLGPAALVVERGVLLGGRRIAGWIEGKSWRPPAAHASGVRIASVQMPYMRSVSLGIWAAVGGRGTLVHLVFLVLVVVNLVAGMQALGTLMAVGLMMLPAAAAKFWSGTVGGLVLTLMTLPTIIIASRSALQAVPPSIREAALGVGASRMQMVVHHVLPLALPGMLTGTIIGMARALGESAPLLMIGMVAFIADVPHGVTDPATVLPVQIYLWADSPERAFVEKTSAAIMVLLTFLVVMNAGAIILRKRFERRW